MVEFGIFHLGFCDFLDIEFGEFHRTKTTHGWSKIALNMFNAKLFPSNIWVLLFLFLIHFLEVGLSGVYCYGQNLV